MRINFDAGIEDDENYVLCKRGKYPMVELPLAPPHAILRTS